MDNCNTAECNKYGLVQRLAKVTHRHTALKESKRFQIERITTCRSLPVSERTREGAVLMLNFPLYRPPES